MVYQVKVAKNDCDCLRFLWWPGGDLQSNPAVYRISVHLFGAVSSPSVANAALFRTVTVYGYGCKCSKEVANVVKKNFCVDDCLKSLSSEEEGVKMIEDVSSLCKLGGFNLTKWISNSRQVLLSVPVKERAKDIKNV